MTIGDALTRIDQLKHNTYTDSEKIVWLSKLDSMIKRFIIDTHEGGEDITFNGYTDKNENEIKTTELLVGEPFDEIYIKWLEAQIDYTNGEYYKYNNSIMQYNTEYEAFENWYNRNHMPLQAGTRFKF